jgi:hypothetical protein
MIPPDDNPMGECAAGYQGILCADCSAGHMRSVDYTCKKCPDSSTNIIRFIFVLIAVILFICFIIKATLDAVEDRNNWVSVFMRIFINHIHLILLTSSFNFNWSLYLRKFLTGIAPVAEASTFVFSIDCFYNDKTYGKVN